MWNYRVVLNRDTNGSFMVSFPDVPEAMTSGANEKEALARAVDALETALELYADAGEKFPVPSKAGRKERTVGPSAMISAKLSIHQAIREQGMRKAALARKLGWHLPQVDRILDLRHESKLEQLEKVLRALGKRLEITVVAAVA